MTMWRDAAGNEIMKNGLSNFQSIYNNSLQNVDQWSVKQLVNEQSDPKLQAIHQQYIQNFKDGTQWFMQQMGGEQYSYPTNAGVLKICHYPLD